MNDTLFGERIIKGRFENGTETEITIKQFRLRQYQTAITLIDDELSLVALAAGSQRGVIEALHPDTFEEAYAALKEVNAKGFFTWSERQLERGSAALKNLPPEMMEKLLAKSGLMKPSPPLPRTAG